MPNPKACRIRLRCSKYFESPHLDGAKGPLHTVPPYQLGKLNGLCLQEIDIGERSMIRKPY